MLKYKFQPISFIILFTIMSTTLYVVANNLPTGVGSFRFFWAPLTLIALAVVKPSIYVKRPVSYVVLYGVLFFGLLQFTLWKYMDEWNRNALLEEFYALIVFVAIFQYYRLRNDYKGFATLGKYSFYFVLITIAMSHIALFIDPMIIRTSASTGIFTENQLLFFKQIGAGGYGYMQALVLVVPLVFYYIKNPRQSIWPKWVWLIFLILIWFLIIRANIFANILTIGIVSLLAGFLDKIRKYLPLLLTLSGILFLIPNETYGDFMFSIANLFDDNLFMHDKFYDFGLFINSSGTDISTGAGGRADRYPLLLEAFLQSPLLGAAFIESLLYDSSGAHLYWMNKLALLGIIGFSFFTFMFVKIFRSVVVLFDKQFSYYYILSSMAFVLIGLMKNISGREPFFVLMILIPGMYFYHLKSIDSLSKKQKVIGKGPKVNKPN